MQGRPFVLGLAVGALAASIPLWLSGDSSAPLRDGPGDPSPAAPTDNDAGPAPSPDALRDQVDRLHAELDAMRSRHAIGDDHHTTPSHAAAPATAVEVIPPDRRIDALLAELDEMLRSGVLRQRCQDSAQTLAFFLLQTWVETGHLDRALSLLQRLDMGHDTAGYAPFLGQLLLAQGDSELAAQAFALGLQANPSDWQAILSLAELDPAAALRLRAEAGDAMLADPDFRSQTALLLLADGRRDEALAKITALIEAGDLSDPLWDALVEREPAFVEEHLRARIAAGEVPGSLQEQLAGFDFDVSFGSPGSHLPPGFPANSTTVRMQLVSALRNQGRTEEARAELDAMLTEWPDNSAVIDAIADLDPGGALSYLRRRTLEQPSPTAWNLYAERLLSGERTEEAIAAYYQAFELEPTGGAHRDRLLELAPERFGPRLAAQAEAQRDDELFGDIADAYWQRGRRDEALDYWRRALEIDPTDSEWVNKIRAVETGRDPFQ